MLDKEFLFKEGYLIFDLEEYDFELYSELKNTFNVDSAKKSINRLRMDGIFKNNDVVESTIKKYGNNFYNIYDNSVSINLLTDNYELLKNELIPQVETISQLWFASDSNDYLAEITNKINKKLIKEIYNQFEDQFIPSELTLYNNGCFIESHNDGSVELRNCAILIYLNEDWQSEYGGELIINKKLYVPPTFGKIVVLDFLHNNIEHAVNRVNCEFDRFAVIRFINK